MIRAVKALLAACGLLGLGLLLRWMTEDAARQVSVEDLPSMAAVTVGVVAWVAYAWLLVAVLATVLEQVPGAVGRAATAVTGRITSRGSRTLLRSALGVAAVTPLTIGVAHASPGDGSEVRSWGPVEPPSKLSLSPSPADWRVTEKASTIRLTEPPAHRVDVPTPPQPNRPTTFRGPDRDGTAVGHASRTGSAHADESQTGDAGVSDWRAVEEPSSVRLTEPRTPTPATRRADVPTLPRPERPTSPATPQQPRTPHAPTTSDPDGPRTTTPTQPPRPPKQVPPGHVGVPDRPTQGAPTRYTDTTSGRPAGRVVAPGESLWSIAAAELGPSATDEQIAARWPRWYAENRAVIGPDPHLLRPGQVLRTPAPAGHAVPPTHQEK